jgi:hypothetical protein
MAEIEVPTLLRCAGRVSVYMFGPSLLHLSLQTTFREQHLPRFWANFTLFTQLQTAAQEVNSPLALLYLRSPL